MHVIKILTISLIAALVNSGCGKTNESTVSKLAGTHSFSGPVKYSFDGFANSPAWEFDSTESLTTIFSTSPSKDSSNYIFIPIQFQEDSRGEFLILSVIEGGATVKVAALVNDTLITIPLQLPASGSSMSIQGDGSIVNNRIKINYQSSYRGLHKYSSLVSQ